jgi:predicted Rossmann fold flavoprotein
MQNFDVLVIGAGGAGMMCAIEAGKRGRQVALIDHAAQVGAKILISGGGRCNFTNTGAGPDNYLSQNPHFAKSALSRYSPGDFLKLVNQHKIPHHEKKLGQLFCDYSARDIVSLLTEECRQVKAEFFLGHKITSIEKSGLFTVQTDQDTFTGKSLVIATGGLSIPKVGATDFGYQIARQFGLKVVEPAPALDGFRLKPPDLKKFGDLTGVSTDCLVSCGGASFRENILFTHVGLSGPAALQISLYWRQDNKLHLNFIPGEKADKLVQWFWDYKRKGSKAEMKTLLKEKLPNRLADRLCELELPEGAALPTLSNKVLETFCRTIQDYVVVPESTVGYNKAEVTRGGVDTDELSSRTMETKKVPGLYFIGEVVDVTGWLGGYNFQWAWSSGWAAGQEV